MPDSARLPVSSREIAGFSAINLPIPSPIGMLLEEKRKSHRRKGKRMPTNMPPIADSASRDRHQTPDIIGLRAHATTGGLNQLCEVLLTLAGVGVEGIERLKDDNCTAR